MEKFILKQHMLFTKPEDSLHCNEGFLADGRSYVSEMWVDEGMMCVTYYFERSGIENTQKAMEEYLIAMEKLNAGETHHLGIGELEAEGHPIYSVTVVVSDDDLICNAKM